MVKAYKAEMKPTPQQAQKILQAIGVCRFLYNRYLAFNFKLFEQGKKFMSGYDFDKYVNHELSKELPWIKKCGSKARKQAIMHAEIAFKRFFKGLSGRPKFKKKRNQDTGIYFPKNNKGDLLVERHRIKVPTLGWVRLKEKGYIPVNAKVKSCTLIQQADRFFLSVLVDQPDPQTRNIDLLDGIGVDLGLKYFAKVSNGLEFKNLNKSSAIKQVEKRLGSTGTFSQTRIQEKAR